MEECWTLSHAHAQIPAQEGTRGHGHGCTKAAPRVAVPAHARVLAHHFQLYCRMLLFKEKKVSGLVGAFCW